MLQPLTPQYPALSASELSSHLRLTGTEELELLRSYLLAAQDQIETVCERALTVRKFRLKLPCFPSTTPGCSGPLPFEEHRFTVVQGPVIQLELAPVRKLDALSYYDQDNATQTIADAALFTDDEPGELRPAVDGSWPVTYARRDAVTVTFWAGHLIPISVNPADNTFTSLTGYPFSNGDTVTLTKSGNTNAVLGDTAALPGGFSERTTYYVVGASGSSFQLSASEGGAAIDATTPASGTAVDLLFAGELPPRTKLALLHLGSQAFGQRCPAGGCACNENDFDGHPLLRSLKWRSPAEFV